MKKHEAYFVTISPLRYFFITEFSLILPKLFQFAEYQNEREYFSSKLYHNQRFTYILFISCDYFLNFLILVRCFVYTTINLSEVFQWTLAHSSWQNRCSVRFLELLTYLLYSRRLGICDGHSNKDFVSFKSFFEDRFCHSIITFLMSRTFTSAMASSLMSGFSPWYRASFWIKTLSYKITLHWQMAYRYFLTSFLSYIFS